MGLPHDCGLAILELSKALKEASVLIGYRVHDRTDGEGFFALTIDCGIKDIAHNGLPLFIAIFVLAHISLNGIVGVLTTWLELIGKTIAAAVPVEEDAVGISWSLATGLAHWVHIRSAPPMPRSSSAETPENRGFLASEQQGTIRGHDQHPSGVHQHRGSAFQ